MTNCMLTTNDNPFDPFTQFDDWYAYDVQVGHHTCAYLARIAKTSDELSEVEEAEAIENAIDEIVKFNINGRYIKVIKDEDSNQQTDQSDSSTVT